MGEVPSQALRRKRDSSLRVAAELVREGECEALVSAGNTGAAMAIGMHVMGVLSDHLRRICERAIQKAAEEGRKTVLDRDFRSFL